MLNFFITTIVFSLAAYILNRIFNTHAGSPRSLTFSIMAFATVISLGAGWVVDKIDGDAELHKNDPSIMEVVKSGDPMKIAKTLAGFN